MDNLKITSDILKPPKKDDIFLEKMKPVSRNNIRQFVKNFIKQNQTIGPFIDVASGYRTNQPEVVGSNSNDSSYVAFDKSVFEFDKIPKSGSSPNLLANAENIPIAKNHAQVVLCTEVLEHVTDDSLILKEIRRILKPGGLLILTVPGKDVPLHEKNFQPDCRRYSPEGISQLLKNVGFSEISLETKFFDGKEINILITAE